MSDVITQQRDPQNDEWKTYDDFADGIDTYRLPSADLSGQKLSLTLSEGSQLEIEFTSSDRCRWRGSGLLLVGGGTSSSTGADASGPAAADARVDAAADAAADVPADVEDPYDAVAVRDDVLFVNLPLESRQREAVTLVVRRSTGRALVAISTIAAEATEGVPQVSQRFFPAVLAGGHPVSGAEPAPSRDLIGKRNLYRYSPSHLYEHVYVSSERYAWQCLEGVQRGHGDMDLSTVWKFDDGLYLFCFREFRIAVASVWLHDLGYDLQTTGIFLGLNAEGASMHSRAGGRIYPLGAVAYPDATPV